MQGTWRYCVCTALQPDLDVHTNDGSYSVISSLIFLENASGGDVDAYLQDAQPFGRSAQGAF